MANKPVLVLALALSIILCVNGLLAETVVWPSQFYDYNSGVEYLWAARRTTSLTDMANYIELAGNSLSKYHGNPCWYYPKIDTDLDVLRNDINRIAIQARELAVAGMDNLAYQQAVQNLQESIIENIDHLQLAGRWLTIQSPTSVSITVVGITVTAILWLIGFITGHD